MPEYPDVELYLHALQNHIVGQRLDSVVIKSPFLLRTWEIDVASIAGGKITKVTRIGKRIVWHTAHDVCLVFHLMITGRYHRKKARTLPRGKHDLAAFHFPEFTLMLTETAKQKRASLHLVSGIDELEQFRRGGLDVINCTLDQFADRITEKNRTVKLALIDPDTIDGIGNAYSDEILHRARLSPFARTGNMDRPTLERLYSACRESLGWWRDHLIAQNGEAFPERVTAYRPEMAVHGKFGEPCPDCQMPVQRIVFSEREWNYCAGCQTNGRRLADRSLSRLLRDEWPREVE